MRDSVTITTATITIVAAGTAATAFISCSNNTLFL